MSQIIKESYVVVFGATDGYSFNEETRTTPFIEFSQAEEQFDSISLNQYTYKAIYKVVNKKESLFKFDIFKKEPLSSWKQKYD